MTGRILEKLNKQKMELGPAEYSDRWQHWKMSQDPDSGIAWLLMDQQGRSNNLVSDAVLRELADVLDQVESEPPRVLVLRSAKQNNFCVGADINEFSDLSEPSQTVDKLSVAHEVVNRLDNLRCPTIAVIHGQCLGGGLELALCCDYRFAIQGAKLGFPEVKLGLHPGLGGTVRLTHLIDPIEAMSIMLTGKTVHTTKARQLGLVDEVLEERHVEEAVRQTAMNGRDTHGNGMRGTVLTTGLARQLEARQMRQKAAKQAPQDHYPAPFKLIDLWEDFGSERAAMARAEIDSFAHLLTTDSAQGLIRVFKLREMLKHEADTQNGTPCGVRHVHVLGAGSMGGDIALWCALQGMRVSLFDTDPEQIAKALSGIASLANRKHLSESQTRNVRDRVTPDLHNKGVALADLIIEAIPEKIELKQKVYREIEPEMKEDAILATNTSSIPLDDLTDCLERPDRFVGLHFFNPVALMPLVEVVHQQSVDEKVFKRAAAFTVGIGKLPALVKSSPGFLVNRVLTPYLVEAMLMLDEGIQAEAIDAAAESFGMPLGPLELADQIGLDICKSVGDMLRQRLPQQSTPDVPRWLEDKIDNGHLGKKTGQGIYQWKDGEAQKSKHSNSAPDDTADRLLLPMVNSCMACLNDGVVENQDILDAAVIMGTGFAPFRGGPLHYARQRGYEDVRAKLDQLARQYGDRFTPV